MTMTSTFIIVPTAKIKLELLPHPPYSFNLSPSEDSLFPNLKIRLRGQKFESNVETISALNGYFEELDVSLY